LELTEAEWIPDKKRELRKPPDVTKEQLYQDFEYDNRNGWLDEICFGENIKKRSEEYQVRNQAAKHIGFDSADEADKWAEVAKRAKENGKTPDEILSQLEKPVVNKDKSAFPTKPVVNSDRREEHLSEQIANAQEKEYEQRSISVRTTRGTIEPDLWLRNQYTNEADKMFCQICKEEMPFRKRDGKYYFEAVETLSIDYFIKEHEAQFLALCPLCAAMYKEFVKKEKGAMETFKNALMNSDEQEVSLQLGNLNTSVRFVESHLHDIRTIIRVQE
jgi:hypothetical protein